MPSTAKSTSNLLRDNSEGGVPPNNQPVRAVVALSVIITLLIIAVILMVSYIVFRRRIRKILRKKFGKKIADILVPLSRSKTAEAANLDSESAASVTSVTSNRSVSMRSVRRSSEEEENSREKMEKKMTPRSASTELERWKSEAKENGTKKISPKSGATACPLPKKLVDSSDESLSVILPASNELSAGDFISEEVQTKLSQKKSPSVKSLEKSKAPGSITVIKRSTSIAEEAAPSVRESQQKYKKKKSAQASRNKTSASKNKKPKSILIISPKKTTTPIYASTIVRPDQPDY